MAVQEWFPLGIFSERLEGFSDHKKAMIDHVYALRDGSGEKRTSRRYSWTGDVHGVDAIHNDPVFGWLTEQLEKNILAYMEELGHNTDKMDIHIQRSWPVIGTRGQAVKKHAHNTAHLSSVFYVSVPDEREKAGRISFYNDALPNELAPGLGSSMTKAYSHSNPLNHRKASYTPKDGLLLLFPAKTLHSVAENETDEDRISVSFDIIITARGDQIGKDEFLMPSPRKWKTIQIGDRSPTTGPEKNTDRQPGQSGALLTKLTNFYRSADRYMLAEKENHILWETRRFLHVSSRADGRDYAGKVAASDDNDWNEVGGKTQRVRGGGDNWPARSNAVDRLYCYLRESNVSADGATVSSPWIIRLEDHKKLTMARAKHHLCVYVRLDHDAEKSAIVAFGDGSHTDLGPGDLVFASGLRTQGLGGDGLIMYFGVNIPSIARTEVLSSAPHRNPKEKDELIFACATAEPLAAPLPEKDKMAEKLKRHASLKRRKFRRGECLVINKFLVKGANPAKATDEELITIAAYGRKGDAAPGDDPIIIEDVEVLSADDCAKLLDYANDHMTSVVPDTVDELPEYQVDLKLPVLTEILGNKAADAVYRLPELLGAPKGLTTEKLAEKTSLFIRKYSPDTRPNIAFHADICKHTINVALNDTGEFEGGDLLVKSGNCLRQAARQKGMAVLHAGNVVHGVTQTTKGVRWSLILFYNGPVGEQVPVEVHKELAEADNKTASGWDSL